VNQVNGHRKAQYVRQVFDTIAGGYDFMNLLMTGGLLRYWHRVFKSRTGLVPGQRAIDVACGTGDLSLIMASQVAPTGEVIGIDFSPEMLQVGREKVTRSKYRYVIELKEGDALDLPFAPDSFDCASIGFALRNVTDIPQVLSELARVVRPGGRVLSLEMSKPISRIIGIPFWWYFTRVVPVLGRLFNTNPGSGLALAPYAWLPTSLKSFLNKDELSAEFERAGLEVVEVISFHGGVVTLHVGVKP